MAFLSVRSQMICACRLIIWMIDSKMLHSLWVQESHPRLSCFSLVLYKWYVIFPEWYLAFQSHIVTAIGVVATAMKLKGQTSGLDDPSNWTLFLNGSNLQIGYYCANAGVNGCFTLMLGAHCLPTLNTRISLSVFSWKNMVDGKADRYSLWASLRPALQKRGCNHVRSVWCIFDRQITNSLLML
jgi:hypothetical protein